MEQILLNIISVIGGITLFAVIISKMWKHVNSKDYYESSEGITEVIGPDNEIVIMDKVLVIKDK